MDTARRKKINAVMIAIIAVMILIVIFVETEEEKAEREPKAELQSKAADGVSEEYAACSKKLQAFSAEAERLGMAMIDESGNSNDAAICRNTLRALRYLEGAEERIGQSCYKLGSVLYPALDPVVKESITETQEIVNSCREQGLL